MEDTDQTISLRSVPPRFLLPLKIASKNQIKVLPRTKGETSVPALLPLHGEDLCRMSAQRPDCGKGGGCGPHNILVALRCTQAKCILLCDAENNEPRCCGMHSKPRSAGLLQNIWPVW